MKAPIKTEVTKEGQSYVDEPVYHIVGNAKPLALSIAGILGREVNPVIKTLSHYKRIPLRWVSPDCQRGMRN